MIYCSFNMKFRDSQKTAVPGFGPLCGSLPAWHWFCWTIRAGTHRNRPRSLSCDPHRQKRSATHLHPVGEPVAFRVRALHCEQNVAPRNDTPLRHGLDFNGQVSIVFLSTQRHTHTGNIPLRVRFMLVVVVSPHEKEQMKAFFLRRYREIVWRDTTFRPGCAREKLCKEMCSENSTLF